MYRINLLFSWLDDHQIIALTQTSLDDRPPLGSGAVGSTLNPGAR
jgi:hypothetical protein